MDIFDVVVVGRGLWGSAAARHVAEGGQRVCLVGPDEPPPHGPHRGPTSPPAEDRTALRVYGAHYDEARITRLVDPHPVWRHFANRSIERYPELERAGGRKFYHEVGFLLVGHEKGALVQDCRRVAKETATPGVRELDEAQLRERMPYLQPQDEGSTGALLQTQQSGYINPRALVEAQTRALEAHPRGTVVREAVTHVHDGATAEAALVVTSSGRRIWAKRVLLACGAFTNSLLPPDRQLDYSMQTNAVVLWKLDAAQRSAMRGMPSLVVKQGTGSWRSDGLAAYILPPVIYPDGNTYLKIGHGADLERTLPSQDAMLRWCASTPTRRDPEAVAHLDRYLARLFPTLYRDPDIAEDYCVTSHTPSGLPICDRISPRLSVLCCGNGQGAKGSDEIGRMAALMVMRDRWDYPLDKALFAARFKPPTPPLRARL